MSKTKLDWTYQNQSGEYRADYKGLVIRAIHDDCPENPFENEDGHWPMLVQYAGHTTTYDKVPGLALRAVLGRFNDALLVHDQKAIGAAIDVQDCDFESHLGDDQTIRKWWTDVQLLRSAFEDALYDTSESERFDVLAKLYAILGIPHLRHTSTGYSQGNQAELLIVATPEAQQEFGNTDDYRRKRVRTTLDETFYIAKGMSVEAVVKLKADVMLEQDLKNQAKLYDAWAWGDVYGYVVCRPAKTGATIFLDEGGAAEVEIAHLPSLSDAEDYLATSATIDPNHLEAGNYSVVDYDDPDACQDLEELTSCWGYHGSDFAWSGLEDAAIEAAEQYVEEKADAQVPHAL